MDEKVKNLRDIFMRTTSNGTFVERQSPQRGVIRSEEEVDADLAEAVRAMRTRYGFRTSLSDDQLAYLVRRFYAGDADADVANDLDVSEEVVRRARVNLHLFRESDTDVLLAARNFRRALDARTDDESVAAQFNVGVSTVRQYRHLLKAIREARRVSHRDASEFEAILSESGAPIVLRSDPFSDVLSATDEGESVSTAS